jgi:hypothetical protein
LREGSYQLYADFLPGGGTPQMIRQPLISSHTDAGEATRQAALTSDGREKIVDGLRVRLEPEGGELVAGAPSLLDLVVTKAADGSAAPDLELYLGARGHLFVLSVNLEDAVHSHPIDPPSRSVGPRIVFQQRFPRAGMYRVWAQVQRAGRVVTVPFTVTVKASS